MLTDKRELLRNRNRIHFFGSFLIGFTMTVLLVLPGNGWARYTGTPYLGLPAPIPGIIQAENFDNGGEQISYYNPTPGNVCGTYRNTDISTCTCTDDSSGTPVSCGYRVGFVYAREWLRYTVSVQASGLYTFGVRAATTVSGESLHILVDGVNVTGSMPIPAASSWYIWSTVQSLPVSLTKGIHVLTLFFDTGNTDVDYINVSSYQGRPYLGSPAAIPGTIQAVNFDNGGENISYYNPTPGNVCGTYRNTDITTCTCTDDSSGIPVSCGYRVGFVYAGEWLNYTVKIQSSGAYTFNVRATTTASGESLHILVDGAKVTGSMAIPTASSWFIWSTVQSSPVHLSAGTHVVRLFFDTGNTDVNYLTVSTATATPTPTPSPSPTPTPTPTATPTPTPTPTATPTPSPTPTSTPTSTPTPTPTPTATPTPDPTPTVGAVNDEFVGPFASWLNVQTDFGATGNGTSDDTTAIQNALNYLQSHGGTLYIPAGTYLISSSLTWTAGGSGGVGTRIIGHDPSDTMIKWDGSSGGTMISGEGFLYFGEMGRITLNGNSTAGIIIDNGTPATENSNYYDIVFENAAYGWHTSANGQNSEIVFLRCVFLNLTTAGQYANASNALDYWFWYCTFMNDAIGVDWQEAGGGVFYSTFVNSGTADIWANQQQPDVFRGNVSLTSGGYFLTSSSGSGALNQLVLQDNRILNTAQSVAINSPYPSTIVAMDNQILAKTANSGPQISQSSGGSGGNGAILIGNQYTVASPWISQNSTGPKLIEVTTSANAADDDRQVSAGSISTTACPLPITATLAEAFTQNLATGQCYPTPPNMNRQCYFGGAGTHATCGASTLDETNPVANLAGDISHACADSAAGGGTRPVIHIPPGTYTLPSTVVTPANCDVQIIGDGMTGAINTEFTGANPALQLHSPSKVRLDNLRFIGGGIYIGSEDSVGSRIQVSNSFVNTSTANDNTVYANGLGNTLINMWSDLLLNSATDSGSIMVKVVGNNNSSAVSRLGIWNSSVQPSSSGPPMAYSITNQGNIVYESGYVEVDTSPVQIINWTSANTGTFTYLSTRYAEASSGEYTILTLNGFPGIATLANMQWGPVNCFGQASVSNSPNVLLSGGMFQDSNPLPSASSGYFTQNYNNFCNGGSGSFGPLADTGLMSAAAIVNQFARVRIVGTGSRPTNAPSLSTVLPSGVTDVQINRADVENMLRGFDIEAGS